MFNPPSKRIENAYAQSLWQAFLRSQEVSRAEDIPVRLMTSFEFLSAYAWQAAERLITGLRVMQARNWREAAAQGGKTLPLYKALSEELEGRVGARLAELTSENAKLISTFPQSVAVTVAARAAAQARAGGRAAELARFAPELSSIARARARLIARTQVSKASSELTQARSEELGLPWYVWRTSSDQRVRASHKFMNDVLVRFSEPPSPELLIGLKSLGYYGAGEIFNCRCYMETLVRLEQVSWPHRCYWNNRIQYLTLNQFKLINQRISVAA